MKKLMTITASILFLVSSVLMAAPTQGNDFHVGPDGSDMELYQGTLTVTQDVSIGDDLTVTGDLSVTTDLTVSGDVTIGGDLTVDDVLNMDDSISILLEGITSAFPSTSSFLVCTATEAVTFVPGNTGPTIATATASAGDYLVITSTATDTITFPVGATHYVVGASSPTLLNTNDALSFIFDGSYWVMISSSVNN
jgi:hypothetical protein